MSNERKKRTFSVDAPECVSCKHYKECRNKRKALCAYLEPSVSAAASKGRVAPVTAEILVKHDYRDVKIGEDTTVTIDMEDIKKQLKDTLYKGMNCAFFTNGG